MIKENLIPNTLTKQQINMVYATEADLFNTFLISWYNNSVLGILRFLAICAIMQTWIWWMYITSAKLEVRWKDCKDSMCLPSYKWWFCYVTRLSNRSHKSINLTLFGCWIKTIAPFFYQSICSLKKSYKNQVVATHP